MTADSAFLTTKFSALLPLGAMANPRYRFSEVLKSLLNLNSWVFFSFCLPNASCVLLVVLAGDVPSQPPTLPRQGGSPAKLSWPDVVQRDQAGVLVEGFTFIKKP